MGWGMLIARELWTMPAALRTALCQAGGRLGTPGLKHVHELGCSTRAECSGTSHTVPSSPEARTFPVPSCVQAHREFVSFPAAAAGRREAVSNPSKCQGLRPCAEQGGRGWLSPQLNPWSLASSEGQSSSRSHSVPPTAPCPPADLGEPLTAPGQEPGSKLHAQPHPSSPKPAKVPVLPTQCSWPKVRCV